MSTHLLRSLLVIGLALLGTGVVHPEGGSCPLGYYPIGGQGTMGCAPLPGAQQAPKPPAERWERRWGAIATDGPQGALGVATDKQSKREASRVAMQDCQSKGGVNCKIDIAYDNQCAVVVVGDGGYNVPNAPTADEAVEMGMKTCRSAGRTNCHVYYSACSLPARIR
ncbi:DUF4189 domain-containing protein [Variovorax paradoxus]|uniref:DUF4189 domain-containing protein n=1 Tax=Variovorax paradoxus TaxID=34073 RepID=A0A6I6H6X6_VARPD|nr:DUF4189 domain-containing protein [Variovorax paradoxus]